MARGMRSYYDIRLPQFAASHGRSFAPTGCVPDNRLRGHLGPTRCLCVDTSSPYIVRKAVATLGMVFRREFGFDFAPYDVLHPDGTQVWLWVFPTYDDRHGNDVLVAFGAAGFSFDPPWTLTWAWFHPFMRRKGYFSAMWPTFRERYGTFPIEEPLSDSMEAFVAAMKKPR